MDELEQLKQLRIQLDLAIKAMDTLRKLTELNSQRIANLENALFKPRSEEDR